MVMQPISFDVLAEKYLKNGEKDEQTIFARVAKSLASVEEPSLREEVEKKFLENFNAGAIGAGRIMSSAGTGIKATLINCFVQPVGDCIQDLDEDGCPGIYEALKQAAETMRRGGGVGYDFSRIRPKGSEVKGTASIASGPCSYINVFDQSCSTVESAGSRRGAQMGVLRIDHPDILDFITAKRTPGRWNNFNVSVGVSNDFMRSVENDGEMELVHKAKPGELLIADGAYQKSDQIWVYKKVKARDVWDAVMQSAYDFAEPGILFLDNINQDNNLYYCERIEATNPCGEQPLPPYGCCDLGPIILTRFVVNPFGFSGEPYFDFAKFSEVVKVQVRMLDNVLDVTYWPLEEQGLEAHSKRRIGVGFTGLGDALIMLKLAYNSAPARLKAAEISEKLRDISYEASIALAQEKGSFPDLDVDQYLSGGNFASRLGEDLKKKIRQFGLRNSHLLSIAPTGTVSLAFADNASNGIEPPFSWTYTRKKREADGSTKEYAVEDHAWRMYKELGGDVNVLPEYFVTALEMSAEDHILMMEAVQPFIDTAISKTVNVPADYPYEKFKDLYLTAWKSRLKGMATYRPNSILGSVLQVTPSPNENPLSADLDGEDWRNSPSKKVVDRRPNGELPAVAEKINYWTQDGQKTLYLIISFLTVEGVVAGKKASVERAIEFFMPVGQSGESQQWITSSMRMLSLAARGGFLARALSDMRKVAWDRGPVRLGTKKKQDGAVAPMWHDSEVAAVAFAIENILAKRGITEFKAAEEFTIGELDSQKSTGGGLMAGKKCPDCGAHAVIKKDGCDYCTSCGYVGACG
ncbi:adenosylcobalamin-dependent ribonucleoside-diphosphate reductase [Polynucleobacter sp. AM-25C3]|uniref:adenosylcobalamin-dependent ribonucleoside-diphosphate reductase n=1 Tax=Polynucleobacter sp. AM-25C3 TaxID=1855569 RepID=UPI001C0ADC90|nr:adenosylcobalamin-dependent ribonucleoside-diphosphate reductase [Polynucleobacter sp. AM-25C3]MBU3602047.1 adenosylcobalamin-dependent ribonucleoside-diphosphate reductase [Polynucleobacter sp. AM-25C3]